jgi:hypothetical protein
MVMYQNSNFNKSLFIRIIFGFLLFLVACNFEIKKEDFVWFNRMTHMYEFGEIKFSKDSVIFIHGRTKKPEFDYFNNYLVDMQTGIFIDSFYTKVMEKKGNNLDKFSKIIFSYIRHAFYELNIPEDFKYRKVYFSRYFAPHRLNIFFEDNEYELIIEDYAGNYYYALFDLDEFDCIYDIYPYKDKYLIIISTAYGFVSWPEAALGLLDIDELVKKSTRKSDRLLINRR